MSEILRTDGAITYLKDGRIKIQDADTTYTLQRPKWKTLRRVREAITDVQATLLEEYTAFRVKEDGLEGDERTLSQLRQRQAREERYRDLAVPVVTDVWTLADRPLPEDPDDWPGWLLADPQFLSALTDFWQAVPLASGQPAT